MSEQGPVRPEALREASAWFARLGGSAVTTESLREFRAWRRRPQNDAAYRAVEANWERAGRLAADPDILRATEAALTAPRPKAAWRTWLAFPRLLVPLTVAAFAAVTFAYLGFAAQNPVYATGVGEQRLVPLADGSRLRLNTDSRVRVSLSRAERRLAVLRGQAFFEVAPDPDRPFVVRAGAASVRALGTKFDVRRDGAAVAVTLLEGRVHVRPGDGAAVVLEPNQQVILGAAGPSRPKPADAARVTSWTSGRLSFHATPLAEAIQEVNRYGARRVELTAPALAAAPVNGVFDVGDTDAFVAAVSMLFDLEARAAPDGHIRLRRRPVGAAG